MKMPGISCQARLAKRDRRLSQQHQQGALVFNFDYLFILSVGKKWQIDAFVSGEREGSGN